MHTSYISTAALRNAPRTELVRLQSELTDRAAEIATQRKADVGLALGTGTGRTVAARMDLSLLETLMVSNGSATAHLKQTQTGLQDLTTVASNLLASVTALPTGNQAAITIGIQAKSDLDRIMDRLNGSDGGSYLFGGQNTQVIPVKRYDQGPNSAIESAFLAKFGVAVGDPRAASIAATDMADFLDNEFAAEFALPAWTAKWSSASSDNFLSRISASDRLETGTNANEAAVRDLAKAFTMIAGLGYTSLSDSVRDVIKDKVRLTLGTAITEIVALKGQLGFAENSIGKANNQMSLARDILRTKIADAEGADPAEAKVRIDLITTQIELSYALTNQLSRLSILNYA